MEGFGVEELGPCSRPASDLLCCYLGGLVSLSLSFLFVKDKGHLEN